MSETFEDHLKWLKEVLDRLVAAGLSVNPEKCLFFRSEINYLGFLTNNEGVKVDPSKLEFSRLGRLVLALYTELCDRSRAPFPFIEDSAAL